ncbi:hypothetical protein [Pseudoalteromonas sp. T1lg23B]|uniref:hypothetical protein n=1 Tax=Pseudoalteromonas sp. T1lg23B TaxID=2077097 RepID=UPI001319E21B|nr:hypothetical protein [Pseudoalteromonas sp. T1lg23B]
MKVQLKKKMLKRLTDNKNLVGKALTPRVGGGNGACFGTRRCQIADQPHDTIDDVPVTF